MDDDADTSTSQAGSDSEDHCTTGGVRRKRLGSDFVELELHKEFFGTSIVSPSHGGAKTTGMSNQKGQSVLERPNAMTAASVAVRHYRV